MGQGSSYKDFPMLDTRLSRNLSDGNVFTCSQGENLPPHPDCDVSPWSSYESTQRKLSRLGVATSDVAQRQQHILQQSSPDLKNIDININDGAFAATTDSHAQSRPSTRITYRRLLHDVINCQTSSVLENSERSTIFPLAFYFQPFPFFLSFVLSPPFFLSTDFWMPKL